MGTCLVCFGARVFLVVVICCWYAIRFGVVLVRYLLSLVRAPEAPHDLASCVRSHGALYPMTDYFLRTIVLHLSPMSADAPWDSLRFYY